MKIPALLAALSLCGCASMIEHEKVEGWPQLQIVENYVSTYELNNVCAPYAGFGSSPLACAQFYFAEGRCVLWFSAEFPPTRDLLEHERLHCRGYDHVGETTMRDFLAGYRTAAVGGRGPIAAAPAAAE